MVNLDPSIPVELAVEGPEGLVPLEELLTVLVILERRVAVIVPSGALVAATPASLTAALFQRPSISSLLFIAQPSKSSEAEAGIAAMTDRSRNSGTIDALM